MCVCVSERSERHQVGPPGKPSGLLLRRHDAEGRTRKQSTRGSFDFHPVGIHLVLVASSHMDLLPVDIHLVLVASSHMDLLPVDIHLVLVASSHMDFPPVPLQTAPLLLSHSSGIIATT